MSRNLCDAFRKHRVPRLDAAASVAGDLDSLEIQIGAISKGDYAAVVAQAHDDVELRVFAPREFNWTSHARGRIALQAALVHNAAAVAFRRPRVRNVLSQRDGVVIFGREQGRVRHTGEAYDVDFVHRFTFRDGRLASILMITAKSTRGHRRHAVSAVARQTA